MSLPYYKRFPRDFLEGTIGLPFEVKCAYGLVLDLIYMRDGRLPDDGRYIAGQLGCSVRKWTSIRDALIDAGKLHVSGGIISNFRADYLTEETRKYQDKQAENRAGPNKNSDLPERSSNQSEAESEPEKKEAAAVGASEPCLDDWPAGRAFDHAALLIEEAKTSGLDPSRQPGLVTTTGRLHAWREAGASWEHDVVPTVTALARKARNPIGSWKFFDNAVAQSVSDNRQALTIPEARHDRPADNHRATPAYAQPSRAERDQSAALAVLARRGLLPGPDQARRVHDGPATGLAQAG